MTTLEASRGLANGRDTQAHVTWLAGGTGKVTDITQIDTNGHLSVLTRHDQPDGHWAIILVLVCALVWMSLVGTFLTWAAATRMAWKWDGFPPSLFMFQRWRWRFLIWPLWPILALFGGEWK